MQTTSILINRVAETARVLNSASGGYHAMPLVEGRRLCRPFDWALTLTPTQCWE